MNFNSCTLCYFPTEIGVVYERKRSKTVMCEREDGRLLMSQVFLPNLEVQGRYYGHCLDRICGSAKVKQSHYRPGQALRVQEVEAPKFLDKRYMKVVRLSAVSTGRLYPSGNTHGTHFC
jgi:hypothetical protein